MCLLQTLGAIPASSAQLGLLCTHRSRAAVDLTTRHEPALRMNVAVKRRA
jgi:hypothetical protein